MCIRKKYPLAFDAKQYLQHVVHKWHLRSARLVDNIVSLAKENKSCHEVRLFRFIRSSLMGSLSILSNVLQACPAKMLELFTVRSWQPALMICSAVGIIRWHAGDIRKEVFVPQPWESLVPMVCPGQRPVPIPHPWSWREKSWDYGHRWHGLSVSVLIPGQAHVDVSKTAVEVLLPWDFWHFWSAIRVGFSAWSITQSQPLCNANCSAAATESCWCKTRAASWRHR